MRQLNSHRIRRPTTAVTVTAPGTLKCGLCQQTLQAPYQSGTPAPCGCDWLWYDGQLVATPNRAAALERILARNRRRALSAQGEPK